MSMIIAWIVLIVLATAMAAGIVWLMTKPMRSLLSANSYMAPAQSFYTHAFAAVISLGALAAVASAHPPCADQRKSMTAMQYVWWVVDGLEPLAWTTVLFLMGYVVLLTVLFLVMGRYRD